MNAPPERMVPKVHPLTRGVEPDDPFTLNATPTPGDPEIMLECIVQEYSWMGWDVREIGQLFYNPDYPALNALLAAYGEAGVRERIARVIQRHGTLQFKVNVREEPAAAVSEPELIELGFRLPAGGRAVSTSFTESAQEEGNRHGEGF